MHTLCGLFQITIPPDGGISYYKIKLLYKALNSDEEKLLLLIQESPQVTQKILQEQSGFSRSKVQNIMKKMTETGILERVGSKKIGYWKTNNL